MRGVAKAGRAVGRVSDRLIVLLGLNLGGATVATLGVLQDDKDLISWHL